MKEMWKKVPVGSKIGLGLELLALVLLIVLMAMKRQVPNMVMNLFWLGLVVTMLSNIYNRRK